MTQPESSPCPPDSKAFSPSPAPRPPCPHLVSWRGRGRVFSPPLTCPSLPSPWPRHGGALLPHNYPGVPPRMPGMQCQVGTRMTPECGQVTLQSSFLPLQPSGWHADPPSPQPFLPSVECSAALTLKFLKYSP